MPLPFNNRAANETTRAWDDIVTGYPAPSDDRHISETIQQIHALDDAPGPDRAFVATLRHHLLASSPATGTPNRTTTTPQITRPTPEERIVPLVPPIPLPANGSRRLPELAAIAAILVLLIAGVTLLRPDSESERRSLGAGESSAPTDQQAATATAAASPTATNAAINTATSAPESPAASSPISILSRPDHDGGLIGLYQATMLVASYLNVTVNDLAAEFVSEPAGTPVYRVSHAIDGVPSPDEIVVDADSGVIIAASYSSHTSFDAPIDEIDNVQAREIAEAFGRATIAEFDNLTFAEENSLGWEPGKGAGDALYSASWFHRAPGSNAWMPTGLIVQVNLRTGLIHGFNIFQADYDGPTEPVIPREEAISTALAAARDEHGTPELTAGRVELMVRWIITETDEFGSILDGEYHLLWMIFLDGVPSTSNRNHIDIDALNGEILVPPVTPNT